MSTLTPSAGIIGNPVVPAETDVADPALEDAATEAAVADSGDATGGTGDAPDAAGAKAEDVTAEDVTRSAAKFGEAKAYLATTGGTSASGTSADSAGGGTAASGAGSGSDGSGSSMTDQEMWRMYGLFAEIFNHEERDRTETLAWLKQRFGEDGATQLVIQWSRRGCIESDAGMTSWGTGKFDHQTRVVIRYGAVILLGDIGTPDVIPALVERSDPKRESLPFMRMRAAASLARMGAAEAIPALMKILTFVPACDLPESQSRRRQALELLRTHNTPEVRAAIAQVMLADGDMSFRRRCAKVLGDFGTPDVVAPLMRMAFGPSEGMVSDEVVSTAMLKLARLSRWEMVPRLLEILRMPRPSGREFRILDGAVRSLRLLAKREAADRMLRAAGRSSLPEIPDEFMTARALPALLDFLNSPLSESFIHTYAVAAEVVGAIGMETEEVMETLAGMIASDSYNLREGAIRALSRIGGERALQLLIRCLDAHKTSDCENQRAVAAAGIARSGVPTALAELRKRIDDPSEKVRLMIVAAIGRLGSEEDVSTLLKVAESDRSPKVRAAAREAHEKLVKQPE